MEIQNMYSFGKIFEKYAFTLKYVIICKIKKLTFDLPNFTLKVWPLDDYDVSNENDIISGYDVISFLTLT